MQDLEAEFHQAIDTVHDPATESPGDGPQNMDEHIGEHSMEMQDSVEDVGLTKGI